MTKKSVMFITERIALSYFRKNGYASAECDQMVRPAGARRLLITI